MVESTPDLHDGAPHLGSADLRYKHNPALIFERGEEELRGDGFDDPHPGRPRLDSIPDE